MGEEHNGFLPETTDEKRELAGGSPQLLYQLHDQVPWPAPTGKCPIEGMGPRPHGCGHHSLLVLLLLKNLYPQFNHKKKYPDAPA